MIEAVETAPHSSRHHVLPSAINSSDLEPEPASSRSRSPEASGPGPQPRRPSQDPVIDAAERLQAAAEKLEAIVKSSERSLLHAEAMVKTSESQAQALEALEEERNSGEARTIRREHPKGKKEKKRFLGFMLAAVVMLIIIGVLGGMFWSHRQPAALPSGARGRMEQRRFSATVQSGDEAPKNMSMKASEIRKMNSSLAGEGSTDSRGPSTPRRAAYRSASSQRPGEEQQPAVSLSGRDRRAARAASALAPPSEEGN